MGPFRDVGRQEVGNAMHRYPIRVQTADGRKNEMDFVGCRGLEVPELRGRRVRYQTIRSGPEARGHRELLMSARHRGNSVDASVHHRPRTCADATLDHASRGAERERLLATERAELLRRQGFNALLNTVTVVHGARADGRAATDAPGAHTLRLRWT